MNDDKAADAAGASVRQIDATTGPICLGRGLIAMKLCIPETMDNAAVLAWVERVDPAGTSGGWQMTERPEDIPRHEGGGEAQRTACPEVAGRVHVRVNC